MIHSYISCEQQLRVVRVYDLDLPLLVFFSWVVLLFFCIPLTEIHTAYRHIPGNTYIYTYQSFAFRSVRTMAVQIILVHLLLLILFFIFRLFSFHHHNHHGSNSNQRNKTTTNMNEPSQEQSKTGTREMKRMKHAYRETSQNPITRTHTLCTQTMFKNITKSVVVFSVDEDLAIDPLRNDIPLVLVVRVFFGFLLSTKAFYE